MSNPLSPEELADLRSLIQASLDERCTPEGYARLQEWICRDEEAGRLYVQYMQLHARLHWNTVRQLGPTPCASRESSRASDAPILGFLGDVFQAGADFLSRSFVWTLLLAIGLPAIVLVVLLVDIARQPVPSKPVAVAPAPVASEPATLAKVTREHACVWDKATAALPAGTPLGSGQNLQLSSGLVEVTFAGGATVLLEGPAVFRVDRSSRGFLDRGKLVAKVPKGAEGFTVATPSAVVTDLGTEFGLTVDTQGAAEAHVFRGRVDVAVEAKTPGEPALQRKLQAGEAVRVSSKGDAPRIETIAAASTPFVRDLPDTLPEPTVIFAHRGAKDPQKEKWRLYSSDGEKIRSKDFRVGPITQDGVAAWSCESLEGGQPVYYAMYSPRRVAEKLVVEAQQKGWVFRARVWIGDQSPRREDPSEGLCALSYRDDKSAWSLYPSLDPQGNQRVYIRGESSLGTNAVVSIPKSRNQYVDYEMRYDPGAKGAEVYVNGRCVAMDFWRPSDSKSAASRSGMLRFGMYRFPSCTRYAKVEWGILRETSKTEVK